MLAYITQLPCEENIILPTLQVRKQTFLKAHKCYWWYTRLELGYSESLSWIFFSLWQGTEKEDVGEVL